MKAIVHIGMPKTGTTAIQHWLGLNAAGLRKRGVVYDRISLPGVRQYVAHVELQLAQLCELDRLVASWRTRETYRIGDLEDQHRVVATFERRLRAVLDNADPSGTFVFSSEQIGATTRTVEAAEALHGWLMRHFSQVRYVVYFRRQEDWLASNYVQTLRRGATHGFLNYCRAQSATNYAKLARHFARAGGAANVTVRLMERDLLEGGDVLADFAALCGVTMEGLRRPDHANEGLSAPACEVLRHLNTELRPNQAEGRVRIWEKAKAELNKMSDGAPRLALSDALRDEIRDANAESNERLRGKWFPERDELFPRREVGQGHLAADPAEVAKVVAHLERRLGRRIAPHLAGLLDVTHEEPQ